MDFTQAFMFLTSLSGVIFKRVIFCSQHNQLAEQKPQEILFGVAPLLKNEALSMKLCNMNCSQVLQG